MRHLQTTLLFVLWPGLVALCVLPVGFLAEWDGYFHVRVAELLGEHGLWLRQFPWAAASIWRDGYFDKDWLGHVLLMPFLTFGRITGPQLAIVVGSLAIVAALWTLYRTLGVANPAPWLLWTPFCVFSLFFVRLLWCRPHLLSLVLLPLALAAMVQRRPWCLAGLSALYALGYTGHWQLPVLVLVYDVLYAGLSDDGARRPRWQRGLPMVVPALAGVLAGELLHPQFPNNLRGLYLQNVQVLRDYWQGAGPMTVLRPVEIRGLPLGEFLLEFGPLVALLAAALIHALATRRRVRRETLLFGVYSAIYLAMTVQSHRFVEYLAPVGVLTLALYAQGLDWRPGWLTPARRALAGWGAIAVLAAYGTVGAVQSYRGQIAEPRRLYENRPPFAGAAAWLAANLAPGEVVFATRFSDNPPLFFGAPQQHYLVFLDIYFMYAYSPEQGRLFRDLVFGLTADPAREVRERFHSRVIFTQPDAFALIPQLDRDPSARRVYADATSIIYLLAPAPLPSP